MSPQRAPGGTCVSGLLEFGKSARDGEEEGCRGPAVLLVAGEDSETDGLRAVARSRKDGSLLPGSRCYEHLQSGFSPFGGLALKFIEWYLGIIFNDGYCGYRRQDLIVRMHVIPEKDVTKRGVAFFSMKSAYCHLPDVRNRHSSCHLFLGLKHPLPPPKKKP